MDFFSDDMRRDPYPIYDRLRGASPVFRVPPPFDAWLVLDYDGVKQVLTDHATFSSAVPAPEHWFLFQDPPRHTKLRGLISKAFTPRVVANLEPRIRELSRDLLDRVVERGEMDLVADYAVPLPMWVIAEMLGIADAGWARFKRWSDAILRLSYARSGGTEADDALGGYLAVTSEMDAYLAEALAQRRAAPRDDLLTRLAEAEVDGERLTQAEILGFFQLLVVGGQETTTNLITNAVLCLVEHPGDRARLEAAPERVPGAIEEVLRYRSPLQWVMRTPTREVTIAGHTIPAGRLVLAMIGSANRDPHQFRDAGRFDITREPNPHVAFGHGIHACLGAPLARLEGRIALTDLLGRLPGFALADTAPWPPRRALHVLGPARLPIRFEPGRPAGVPG